MMVEASLITSRNDTAPKRIADPVSTFRGLITSQNDTAPKHWSKIPSARDGPFD